MRNFFSIGLSFAVVSSSVMAVVVACGGDSETRVPQAGGTGGSAGASASGGGAGSSGRGGSAGSAGRGGSAGTAGTAGSAGTGTGGTAGSAGASGTAGTDAGVDAGTDASADAPADSAPDADPACRTIPVDATLTAHLQITADNECEVFVNGTSVGTTNNWGVAVTIDVSLFLHPGKKNAIGVRGTNTSSQGGNDRGIIGQITIDMDGGRSPLVFTDAAWRVAKTEETGWTAVDFDDSAWTAAVEIASNGDPPWGTTLSVPSAKWIWSALVPASTNDKPNLETAYARREFYVASNGTTITEGPGCP